MGVFRYDSTQLPIYPSVFPFLVVGDSFVLDEPILQLRGADAPTRAWLTIKTLPDDLDTNAILRKEITTTSSGAGQLLEVSGVWTARFTLAQADTLLVTATAFQHYDVQVLLSTGALATIRYGPIQGEKQITNASVASLVPVASVTVTGTSPADLNTNQLPTVVLRDASANILTGRTITYTSSNEAVAIVTVGGRVYHEGAGTATITATSEGVSGTLALTVARPVVISPDFSWVPARDGFFARGQIGLRSVHLAARTSSAAAGSSSCGIVFQDRGEYALGTDEWNEFGGTTETIEPVVAGATSSWNETTIVSEVDPGSGLASTYYSPGYFHGSIGRRWNHNMAWDGVNYNLRPFLSAVQSTTAMEAGGQAAGDDLLFYWIIAYRTGVAADVGKKQVVRATAITSGFVSELARQDKTLIVNRIADCFEQTITLSGQWQVIVAPLRCTAAEWATVRVTGQMRCNIMQADASADRSTSIILDDGWHYPFAGIPDNKTGKKFAFRPRQYRAGDMVTPNSTGGLIPRHESRLFSRFQNPAIVQSLQSDNPADAVWVKGGGVTISASTADAPDRRIRPGAKLASVFFPTGGYLEQDCDHWMEAPGALGDPQPRAMGYRAIYPRFYARQADGAASPDLTGFTETITTLVAGVPTTVYGPTATPSGVDEFGMCTTRFGFPSTETATRYRRRLTNTGAPRTLLMYRNVVESGSGNNGGGESVVATMIPCRTTTGFRGQNGTHWMVMGTRSLVTPRDGAWLVRTYMTQDYSDPLWVVNTGADGALVVDHGPIGNLQRKIGLNFQFEGQYARHDLFAQMQGDTSRGRLMLPLIDVQINQSGIGGSGLKYGTLAQAGGRGLRDFGLVWENYVGLRTRVGTTTYEMGFTPADVNYTAEREWTWDNRTETDNDQMTLGGDRDRRLALCANFIAAATWFTGIPSASEWAQTFQEWPTGAVVTLVPTALTSSAPAVFNVVTGTTYDITVTLADQFENPMRNAAITAVSSDTTRATVVMLSTTDSNGVAIARVTGGSTLGATTITLSVGALSLSYAATTVAVPTDYEALITSLGGNAQVPGFYDVRIGITASGGLVDSWADARGAGFGPQLAAAGAARPTWDATNLLVVAGAATDLASAEVTGFDISGAKGLVFIGAAPLNSTSNNNLLALFNAAISRYFSIVSTPAGALSALTTPVASGNSSVVGSATRRAIIAGIDGTTFAVSLDIPNAAGVTSTGASAMPAGTNALHVGLASTSCRAIIVLNHKPTAADITEIKNWAVARHAVVLA